MESSGVGTGIDRLIMLWFTLLLSPEPKKRPESTASGGGKMPDDDRLELFEMRLNPRHRFTRVSLHRFAVDRAEVQNAKVRKRPHAANEEHREQHHRLDKRPKQPPDDKPRHDAPPDLHRVRGEARERAGRILRRSGSRAVWGRAIRRIDHFIRTPRRCI